MFPKKGKLFPNAAQRYSAKIAIALKEELGDTHRAVKIAMRWTGASDRTVKHWLSGRYGPNGEHLMALAHHSDHVMLAIIGLAGRETINTDEFEVALRHKLTELAALLDSRFRPKSEDEDTQKSAQRQI